MQDNVLHNSPTDDLKQQTLDSILENLPIEVETEVSLPSKCKFYSLPDPASPVSIRPMTFEDEKSIATINRSDKINPINYLLGKCVINLNVNELLLMDKLYLLYKIREVSYGPEYKASITCPKCLSDSEIKIDISKLLLHEVPDDLTNPRTINLPILKKDVTLQFPRLRDEKYLNILEHKNIQLWRFVENIDGYTDKQIISKVIEKLPLKDMHLLLSEITKPEYGLDSKINFICGDCESETVVDIPIGENFFS